MAQRLSKTRNRSTSNCKQNQRRYSEIQLPQHNSMSEAPRRSSATDLYHRDGDETNLTMNIRNWLYSTSDSGLGLDNKKEERSQSMFSVGSIFESDESDVKSDSDTFSRQSSKENQLPEPLMQVFLQSKCVLEDVSWDMKSCDILLKVNYTLFPVSSNFVAYVSDFFQVLFDDVLPRSPHSVETLEDIQETPVDIRENLDERDENENTENKSSLIIQLDGYDESEIRTVLQFIYSTNVEVVSDENVAGLLQLAEEFGVTRLRFLCENYLKNSSTFNPMITLHLAKQYKLENLLDYSCKQISKIDDVESLPEFNYLDCKSQNKVLLYVLQRFRRASETLTQFDVHLCNHHGNDPKNSSCCFRAATYSTKKGRTFLVQMEHPEEKLSKVYKDAFNCATHDLNDVEENV